MDVNQTALTFDELSTTRAIIRVIRYLTVLGAAILAPLLVAIATPVVGGALLSVILLAPVLLVYVLVLAARQAEAERRVARG